MDDINVLLTLTNENSDFTVPGPTPRFVWACPLPRLAGHSPCLGISGCHLFRDRSVQRKASSGEAARVSPLQQDGRPYEKRRFEP